MIMFPRPNVWVDTLGVCWCCRKIITVQWVFSCFLSNERIICFTPGCGRVVIPKDFGYKIVESGGKIDFVKNKWIIGPNGKWAEVKPSREFDLPRWHVVLNSTEADFNEKYAKINAFLH
jgi:hypothetical protein